MLGEPQQVNNNMSPNLEPPRTDRRGPSEATWEAMKPHIRRKYIEEGRTLTDVMQTMRTEHDFKAS